MQSQRLGLFITFILLAVVPKNPADADSDLGYPQPATANLIPLTLFLKTTLQGV